MTKSEINKRYAEKKLKNHPYKICTCCKEEKHIDEFSKKGERRFSQCKKCRSEQYFREAEKNRKRAREYYEENKNEIRKNLKEKRKANLPKEILRSAKQRAKEKGLEFNIDETDIHIPDICPVLGMPLVSGNGKAHDASPSIDRIDPTKGYIKGNVIIVSYLANTIKTNATVEQIRKVADFYEQYIKGAKR